MAEIFGNGYILYIGCPFCGKSVHLSQVQPKTYESYDMDWKILQFRKAAGGRGRGGFYIAKEGLSIKEMLNEPEFRPLAEKVLGRFRLIYETWKREGII